MKTIFIIIMIGSLIFIGATIAVTEKELIYKCSQNTETIECPRTISLQISRTFYLVAHGISLYLVNSFRKTDPGKSYEEAVVKRQGAKKDMKIYKGR